MIDIYPGVDDVISMDTGDYASAPSRVALGQFWRMSAKVRLCICALPLPLSLSFLLQLIENSTQPQAFSHLSICLCALGTSGSERKASTCLAQRNYVRQPH